MKCLKKICSLALCLILAAPLTHLNSLAAGSLNMDMTLYQQGNQLVNGRGQVVRLLGVNVPQLAWSAYGDGDRNNPDVVKVLDYALDDWQCNVIRLAVLPQFWLHGSFQKDGDGNVVKDSQGNPVQDVTKEQYRALVDSLIGKIAAQGKYVVLDNHAFFLPGPDSEAFWADAAVRYQNHPNVIFGLFNEPAACTWEQWHTGGTITYDGVTDWGEATQVTIDSKGVQNLVDIVRGAGADNLVTLSGLNWGYDLSLVTTTHRIDQKGGNGLMFETHPYPERTNWDVGFGVAAREYPILFGECGPESGQIQRMAQQQQVPEEQVEQAYVDKLLTYLDLYEANMTAWAMGADPHLLDWSKMPSFVPTSYGARIRDYIGQNLSNKAVTLYDGAGAGGNSVSLDPGRYTAQELSQNGFQLQNVQSVASRTSKYDYIITLWSEANYRGLSYEILSAADNLSQQAMGFAPQSVTIERVESRNFIRGANGQGVRALLGNIGNQTVKETVFGSEANGNPLSKLTDGDKTTHIDIWGGMQDDETGRDIPGVRYDLGESKAVSQLNLYVFRQQGYAITGVKVYAGNDPASMYTEQNLIYQNDACQTLNVVSAELSQPVTARYVTIFLTGTQSGWRAMEFEVMGEAQSRPLPLLEGLYGQGVYVRNSDYSQIHPVTFSSEAQGNPLSKLTDGDVDSHIDFWGGVLDSDQRGVLYDLGEDFLITSANAFVFDQEGYAITGVRIYAGQDRDTLGSEENLIYCSEGVVNGAQRCVLDTPKRARYIVFLLTSTQNGWRAKEFEASGISAAQQDAPSISSDRYQLSNQSVSGVMSGETAEEFLSGISVSQGRLALSDAMGDEAQGNMATNMRLRWYVNDTLYAQYRVVVYGDVNGDGLSNADDVSGIREHILGSRPLQGAFYQAASEAASISEGVTVLNMVKLRRYLAGLTLFQKG